MIRAGARDLLVGRYTDDELRSLIQRLVATFEVPRLPSTVLAVLGAAGGCGASTLTANLAAEIAKLHSVPVGILGLNCHNSGVELLLDLHPDITLLELWKRIGSLDISLVDQAVARHASGVSLVTAGEWPLEDQPIPGKIVRRVSVLMQQLFPYVLVDIPSEIPPAAQAVLDHAEALVLVTQYSMTAAAGAARSLQTLAMLGYPKERIQWVANCVSQPAGLTIKDLRRVVSRQPLAQIPFDPQTVNRAAADGVLLYKASARSSVTTSIRKLAATLCKSVGGSKTKDTGNPTRTGQAPRSEVALAGAGVGK